MLQLKNILKKYKTGDTYLTALNNISINFRDNEFVAILGQSGCGKTTLLNIIGGLDQYTDGDLIINGISTKEYKDSNWDSYRNHSVGFVFQSYNLISHQTVLANVELALTLSGVSKDERRKRAIEALEKVGLGDQLNKKPNQLSGGQMQRVAIARSLVNNPDILLADEPTGALDSSTSIQIMDILKEVAKDRLVIMVTHNPDLAYEYANRIVKLKDGEIVDDSNPFTLSKEEETAIKEKTIKENRKIDKTRSMSFFTALSLSFNNLMTKKGRTILTAFAGSIGIIGIALILSVSTGVNNYIDSIERSTMSSYPIILEETSMDLNSMMGNFQSVDNSNPPEGYIKAQSVMTQMLDSMVSTITVNNLKDFKVHLENANDSVKDSILDIKYGYAANLNTYYKYGDNDYKQTYSSYMSLYEELTNSKGLSSMMGNTGSVFTQMIGDEEFFNSQYDFIYGSYPQNRNEVLILVDENRKIPDVVLYALGILDMKDLVNYRDNLNKHLNDPNNYPKPAPLEMPSYSFDNICGYTFPILLDSDYFELKEDGKVIDHRDYQKDPDDYLINLLNNTSNVLKISGIVKVSEEATQASTSGGILYTKDLMLGEGGLIEQVNNSDVVKYQLAHPDMDILLGSPFVTEYTEDDKLVVLALIMKLYAEGRLVSMAPTGELNKLSNALSSTDPASIDYDYIIAFANKYLISDVDQALKEFGYVDFACPSSIRIYPKDFNSKDIITNFIEDYNASKPKADKIVYTDMVGVLLSSITIIVNAISYVLIAFVSISLVVSSIMIGIITYISVLERTKEIGILRSIGASKKDISRVFNAESITVGFAAGLCGILISLILLIPINIILHALTGISYLSATLPFVGSIILIIISVVLTFIAGLIPSRFASKKDPVVALRTE